VSSSAMSFTVTPAPSISSLTPSAGALGSSIVIAGSNFEPSQGNGSVTFNGTAATVTNWTAGSITATVPAGATTGNVVVTAAGGVGSSGASFTITPAPSISSLTPNSGVIGASVTIAGSNLGSSQGNGTVTFNGTAGAVTSWGATSITTTVPTGATTGNVVVTAAGGIPSNGASFSVLFPPVISSVSPASGEPGASIAIAGSHFTGTTGAVTFNGQGASISSWSDTNITAVVPNGGSSGNVVVTAGTLSSNGMAFSVLTPAITSLTPASGAPGTSVTVAGTSFGASAGTVTFNGQTATTTSWSDTSIVVAVPTGATTGNVVVSDGGLQSNGSAFTVAPIISSLTPTTGHAGSSVTIAGTNFTATAGTTTFNGQAGTVSNWSNTSITAVAPNGASSGNVVVTAGTLSSNGVAFTVVPLTPTVAGLTPATGATGTQVQIHGSAFGATQGTSTVAFNGVSAIVGSWADSQITATVPSAAVTGPVQVTVAGAASNSNIYFNVPPPVVSSISPSSGVVGTQVTVNGSGFQAINGSNSLQFNGYSAAIGSWSDTQIIATVPSGAATGPVKATVNGVGSNQDVLFTMPNPIVTGLVPASGPVGTQVQVNGRGFGATQGTSTITFYYSTPTVVSWSDTQIVAIVPNQAISGAVKVTVSGIVNAANIDFNIPGPQVTSITPASGVAGTQVTVNGSNFQAVKGNGNISFNGLQAAVTNWSNTQIVATVPSGSLTGPVVVVANNGTASNRDVVFTPPNPPVVTGVVPSSGPVGTQVQISGSGFGATQGTSTFVINYANPTIVSWSDSQIVATVPATGTGGAVNVTVGNVASNTSVYFNIPAPRITSISPANGVVGTQVTVNGSGFQATKGNGNLTFKGLAATVVSWSDTQIVAAVPAGAATGAVSVSANNYNSSNQDQLFTMPNPVVATVSPVGGPVGAQVQINGSGFGATQGTSTVAFNSTTATVTSWSDTQIVATVPSGTSGAVSVSAIEGGVTSNTNVIFTAGNLTVNSVSPHGGPTGTQVTVSGVGFGATQSGSTVSFNNVVATSVSSWSDSQILATVPATATTGAVKIVNGGASSNTSVNFTVGAVAVNSVSPASGPTGTQVQINGKGFGATQGSSTITLATYYPFTVVSWSDTQITASAPNVGTSGAVQVTVGGAASNGDVNFTVTTPNVSNISPSSGPVGTQIQVNGTGFGATQGSGTVTFYGQTASVVSWSDTQAVVIVPANATTGPVKVSIGNVSSPQNITFTVPAPQIATISPSSGVVGTQITITGTGFQASQGSGFVRFSGPYATGQIVSWSDTQIVATAPSSAVTGAVMVVVNNAYSNANVLFTMPNPQIVGASPSSGPVGTQVQIKGSGFGATQGTSVLQFYYYSNATVTSWSDTQIVATVPTAAATGPIQITEGGVSSNTNINFTVPPPQVAGVSPSTGPVGTQVTVNGSGFGATRGSSNVFFGNVYASVTSYSSWSDTQIIATVPANAVTGPLQVGTGSSVWSNVDILFTLPNPLITGLSPSSGPEGTQVQINGIGFGATQGASTMKFNGVAASVVSWSDAQIVAVVPSTASSGPVQVTEGGVGGNANIYFTVPAPQIISLSPTIGGEANPVTINGSGFHAAQGSNSVIFNGRSATATSWSDAQIVATVPSGSSTGPVKVYVNGVDSNLLNYTVPSLVISSLTPSTGPVGTQVTLTGVAFGATQGTSILNFNGQPAGSIVSWTDTQIVATVPVTAASGPAKVVVNSVNSNNNVVFTVPPPSLGSVTPVGGALGTQVTITGTGFQTSQRDSTVTFNGTLATATSWSDTQIVTTVPTGATTGYLLVTVNSASGSSRTPFDVANLTLTSLAPPEAPVGGVVTITGTGFGGNDWYTPDGNTVIYVGFAYLNGIPIGVVSWSDTAVAVQVPTNATSGNITITKYNDTSNALHLVVEGAPTVTGLSPAVGAVGSTVTITGNGFGSTQSNSAVQFYGGTNAAGLNALVTSWSDTQIVAIVPPFAATGPVGVIVAGVGGPAVNFALNTTVQVTDSFANASSYTSEMRGGAWNYSGSTGSGCSSCTVRGNLSSTLDSTGNVLSHTDELGHVTSYTYDADNNLVSQAAQLDGSTTVSTSYTYNSFGEPLAVTDPLGNVTTNTYDANGNLLTVTSPKPDAPTAASATRFAYDTKGQLTQITDPLSHITTLAYYPTGLIQTITDAQSNATSYEYDMRGNRTAVVDAQQNRTTFTYDLGNRLTKITYPDTTFSSFAYDGRGRRTSVTDQNGKVTSYAYDDADRLTSVTDAAQNATHYAYDLENNLTSITDAAQHTTSFVYDAFGRVTQTAFPSSLTENYVYDAVGNLTSKVDRKNQTIQYVYDALNRLSHKGYPDATGVDYVYDLAGKIKQVSDPTGTYGMAYDNMGRLIGTTTQYSFLPGITYSNAYGYDAASNRTSFTAPDGSTNTYAYDTLGRMTSLTNSLTGQFGYSYDALSRRTALTRPNGINTSYGYDSLSRLLNVLHKAGTATLDGAGYTYDNAGNRTAKTNYLNNTTEQYTYDPTYQLTQVTQGTTTTESYSYDAVGNRLSSLSMSPYAYNSSNELTSTPTTAFTYDNNGNTLTKVDSTGTTAYNWNFENRLTSVVLPGAGGTATFIYDPLGRRIQKSSSNGTTNFLYDGTNSVEEVDSSGALLARYSQGEGMDEPLSEVRNGSAAFYEQDGLSSVTSISGSASTLSNSYTYDSFGNNTGSTGSFSNPLQYTGRDYDSETGLRYYRDRYYDPQSGRFLSEDPIGFGAGDDFYSYVLNNPVNLRDPSGRNPNAATWPTVWPWIGPAGRGVVAVCFATGACETIMIGGAGVGVIALLQYGVSHAAPIETDWRKQPQFQCGNPCRSKLAQILALMSAIKVSYYEMMTDPWDLFNTAYFAANPSNPKGSWLGHEEKLIGYQVGLARLIGEAKALGCPVPEEAEWLTLLNVPSAPGWKGYKP
jgi:RHS repeat-associated protein